MVAGDDAIVRIPTCHLTSATNAIRSVCAQADQPQPYGYGQIIRIFDVTPYTHFKTLSRHVIYSHGSWNIIRLPERMLYKSAVDKTGVNKLKAKIANTQQLLSELLLNPVT